MRTVTRRGLAVFEMVKYVISQGNRLTDVSLTSCHLHPLFYVIVEMSKSRK